VLERELALLCRLGCWGRLDGVGWMGLGALCKEGGKGKAWVG